MRRLYLTYNIDSTEVVDLEYQKKFLFVSVFQPSELQISHKKVITILKSLAELMLENKKIGKSRRKNAFSLLNKRRVQV